MISATAGPQTAKFSFGQPAAPNLNVHLLCPNCKEDPPNLVEEYSKGDIVCASCGSVLGDRIVDTRSEWRTFAGDENGDDPSRVGDAANPLLGETFETVISGNDGRSGIARDLQRAQSRQHAGPGNRTMANLSAAFGKINEKCETMQLPRNVIQRAQWAYKVADDNKLVRGKDIDAAIGACIILGCRDAKVDRSLLEVSNIIKVDKKKIGRALLALGPVVNLELAHKKPMAVANKTEQSTLSLIARLINLLALDNETNKIARYVAERAGDQNGVIGRSPVSIAAGVLYFAVLLVDKNKEEASAKEIAKLASVSDSTIKFICKKIAVNISEVIKPEWSSLPGYDSLLTLGKAELASNKPRPETPKSEAPASPKEEIAATPKSEVATP